MKTFILSILLLFAIAAPPLHAQIFTIVEGQPDYIGDFPATPALITNSTITETQLNDGWVAATSSWTIASNAASRTTTTGFQTRGIGMAFDNTGITDDFSITFDYTFRTTTQNPTWQSGYFLYGINTGAATFSTIGLGGTLATTTPTGTNLTLLDSLTFSNGTATTFTGSHDSGVLTSIDRSLYDGYVIVFHGLNNSGGGAASSVSNVALTVVPEPSTALLLLTGFGLCFSRRRR